MQLFEWFGREGRQERHGTYQVSRTLGYDVNNLQNIGSRERQEDSFAFVNALDASSIQEKGMMAAVADGMGGMENGKAASDAAIQILKSVFSVMDREKNIAIQLKNSFLQANDRIYEQFGGRSGTTLIACIFYQGDLYFASVGDSYLFLKRGEGLYRLNREQNYLHQLYLSQIKEGELDPARVREDKDACRLSQFIGMKNLEDIDYIRRPFSLQSGDVILLCSDGVGGTLNEKDIYSCLCGQTSGECCRMLEREVRQAGYRYQDNYTALVISCNY